MTTTKHTPGPWIVDENNATIFANDSRWEDPTAICKVDTLPGEETDANARLIAAAPELLEALESLLIYCQCSAHKADDWMEYNMPDNMTKARAAIANSKRE